MGLKLIFLREAPKIADENEESSENKNKSCGVGEKTKKSSDESEKLELQHKSVKYIPFVEFVQNLKKPTENISAAKLKRLSKAYLLFLVLNGFYQMHKRSFSPQSDEDRAELIKIKTDLFEQMKINQDVLPETCFLE